MLSAARKMAPQQQQPVLFSGKKHESQDSFTFKKPGKGTLISALLLSSAGIAGAAPVKGNATDITVAPSVSVTPENPFALDLHEALNPLSAWDNVVIADVAPTDKSDHDISKKEDHKTRKHEKVERQTLTTQQAIAILKKPPFAPMDKNVFNSVVYGGTKAAPAPARTQTVSQLKSELTKAFTKRFNGDSNRVKKAVALMDDTKLKATVPDARLRAAIVNLQGTSGEAAISAYRSGIFSTVRFAPLDPSLIAHGLIPSGQKPLIEVNSRYQHESIRLLSHVLAHEPLHQDLTISVPEERLAHAMDTLVHGKVILEDPTLISKPTEFTQRLNTKLMARLNSRDKNGGLRLFQAQGPTVYPGSKVSLANFGANFVNNAVDGANGVSVKSSSPGNAVLRGELAKTTGKTPASNANFDSKSEALVDQYQAVFSPVELVNLAKVLKLKTNA